MSGRVRRLERSEVKRLNRAARSYNKRVSEYLTARAELAGVGDRGEVNRLSGLLDVEAGNLRSVRETIVNASRDLGVGVVLVEVN